MSFDSVQWRKSGFYETFKAPKAGHNLVSRHDTACSQSTSVIDRL